MITLFDNFEGSSVNLRWSSATASEVLITPAVQGSEVISDEKRWLRPTVGVRGVVGINPTFAFLNYTGAPTNNSYHGGVWHRTQKPVYSYDRKVWYPFDFVNILADRITFSKRSGFLQDTIYVSGCMEMTVSRVGEWLDSIKDPAFGPAPSANAYPLDPNVGSFPGQDFIAGAFVPQINGTSMIPWTPFYAAEINDTSLMPASGVKQLAVLVAGVHGGEDLGNYTLCGVTKAILDRTSPWGNALRKAFRIRIYPMMNPVGRYGGGWRGSYAKGNSGEDDLNRHFKESQTGLEIIDIPKHAINFDRNGQALAFSFDFHGTYTAPFTMFVDQNRPTDVAFKAALENVSGSAILNEGSANPGFTTEYFRSLGASPSITHETGTTKFMTVAELNAHGADFVEALAQVKGLNGVISNVVVPVPVPTPAPAPVVPPAPVVVTPPPLPPSTAQVFSGNFTVTINNDGTRTFTGTYR